MKISKIITIISSIAVLLAILLSIIFMISFDHSFYEKEYADNHQAEVIGMSDSDLMKSTDTLLDYLQGKRNDIIVEVTMDDHVVTVFNERETLHMVDVRNLLVGAENARNLLLLGGLIGLTIVLILNKSSWVTLINGSYKKALLIIGVTVAALGIWAFVDFDTFWVDFHYLFFDNDLFFLDPNTSIMINMFPSSFFFDLVFRIIIVFVLVIAVIYVVLHWFYILKKREVLHHD